MSAVQLSSVQLSSIQLSAVQLSSVQMSIALLLPNCRATPRSACAIRSCSSVLIKAIICSPPRENIRWRRKGKCQPIL
uniref:Candidate secreted effector n=1 Tax=Meloidogyne incognita TaxID=6306 RepID=A0A914KLU8_MELIC